MKLPFSVGQHISISRSLDQLILFLKIGSYNFFEILHEDRESYELKTDGAEFFRKNILLEKNLTILSKIAFFGF